MKKFKFRLQTVLDYRERERNDKKGELLKANQALAEAEAELERLRQLELENYLSIQEVSPVSTVLLNAQIAEGLKNRIANQVGIIELRKEDVAKALEVFKEASKELKSVTILKERKLHEYNKRIAEQEAEFLDELSIQRSKTANQL